MNWESPVDAMPWVGLYVFIASLICTLAMAADVYQGFRQWKLWFPCRFFTMNAASITLIGIALKPPVDLSTDISYSKLVSIIFMLTMFANLLPSLGLMDDNELLMNIIAFGILIITITVNVWIQLSTRALFTTPVQVLILILPLPWPFSVALTVSASRRILQQRYKELHKLILASSYQEINFSSKELKQIVQKYWMMAETGNPQFAIACSSVASAFGVISSILACIPVMFFIVLFIEKSWRFNYEISDYKWSMNLIVAMQFIGIVVGSIAPVFRCMTTTTHFNLSKEWSKNHLNVFRVEKQWIQTLKLWKRSHVPSYITGRHFKKVLHNIKNMILNVCIVLQIMVVVICNTLCLIPRFFLIIFSCCCSICKSLFKRPKEEPNESDRNVIADTEVYTNYVLQIEQEAKLSKRILRNTLNSLTRLLHESEKKEPKNLMKLLKKSKEFAVLLLYASIV